MNEDSAESTGRPGAAAGATILLPVAYGLHLLEEWYGGLPEWTRGVFGYEISAERFVLINAIALAIFVIAALAAAWKPRYAWCAVTLAALLGLNGLLHALIAVLAFL